MRQEITNLDNSEDTMYEYISADVLEPSPNIHFLFLTDIINKSFRHGKFPNALKYAEIFLVYQNKNNLDKENYRPVSVLLYMPKIFERLMYQQIEEFVNSKLSLLLTGFRKNHSTQHCLLNMIENWEKN